MKQIKYILSTFVLLFPVLAHAQDDAPKPPVYTNNFEGFGNYKIENGIGTRKSVTGPVDGAYTLTLETFATGVTSTTQKSIPSDIVLVLDLSTSMGGHRGYVRKLTGATTVSIDDVESDDPTYGIYRDSHGFGYQISTFVRNNRCYLYSVVHSEVRWINKNGTTTTTSFSYANLQNGGGTLPNQNNYSVANTAAGRAEKAWTFSPVTQSTTLDPETGNPVNDLDNDGLCEDEIVVIQSSRLHELKDAVNEFIDEVVNNNLYMTVNGQKVARDTPLGNKLAIVSWADYLLNSNTNGDQTTDLLELTTANITALKDVASNFTLYDGTKPNLGIDEANRIFRANPRTGVIGEDYFRTIVFFTDGQPDNGFDPAITSARTSKLTTGNNAVGAKVYSVGLFSLASGQTEVAQDTQDFMNYVSSNYPDATAYDSPGTKDPEGDYYKDVSTGELTLSDVFKTIAANSGGAERTLPGETRIVDAVSNSFKVAEGFEASDVKVYTRSLNEDGDAWGDLVELQTVVLPSNADLTPDDIVGVSLANGTVEVTGFNYSKADSETAFDGNWVGWRYDSSNNPIGAGKELVIKFNIQSTTSATGGDLTNTNAPGSGIKVPIFDDNGNVTGYEDATEYPFPRTDLPINLTIVKKGLRYGESATIQIYRAPMSDEINATTGKFKPYLPNGEKSWENFSKVILTNKEADGADVVKELICLDAGYVYKLEEDNWGFGYKLDDKSVDTSEQETNPFVFTNTLKTTEEDWGQDGEPGKIIKHAEAVSINHFGYTVNGTTVNPKVENYKSSKVESF